MQSFTAKRGRLVAAIAVVAALGGGLLFNSTRDGSSGSSSEPQLPHKSTGLAHRHKPVISDVYCIYARAHGKTYFKLGPNGPITRDPGPVTNDCNAST